MFPDHWSTAFHFHSNTVLQLLLGYIEIGPGSTVSLKIANDGLYPINGLGKDCVIGLSRFEFMPKTAIGISLIRRQKTKDPVGSSSFNLFQRRYIVVTVDGVVACIYLDEVMNQ